RLCRAFPRKSDHARREDGRGARAVRCGGGALAAREPRQACALRRHRRRALQADRAAGRGARPRVRGGDRAGADRQGQGAGVGGPDVDLIVVATVTPDMMFPSTAALLADELGSADAAAYDLSAGCTGFMYALAQAYGMLAGGLAERALVVGGDILSRILDWSDRSTLVLFGDGAGAVVLERVESGGFLGFELGAEGGGGVPPWLPARGPRP